MEADDEHSDFIETPDSVNLYFLPFVTPFILASIILIVPFYMLLLTDDSVKKRTSNHSTWNSPLLMRNSI